MTNYVILGAGVAGIGAAESIRKLDPTGVITVVCDDPHGYYSRPGLAYLLTGEVDESSLFPFPPQDLKNLGLIFRRGTAIRILHVEKQVELSDGQRLPYDRLLVAVGCGAVRLKLPGVNLQGVVKLDDLEDARRIIALARRARTAVVVGGGITALELAEGLAHQRVKVHLLIRSAHYWSNVLDEVESIIVERRLTHDGIVLHYHSELAEIVEKSGRVAGVRLNTGQQLACDVLAYGIGVQPRLTLAREAGINFERGILVDEYLRTNLPDVYAAGDVAQVYDPVSGRSILDSLWTPARDQGRVAGKNMAGAMEVYSKAVPFNVTRLAGLTTTIIGAVGSGGERDSLFIARGDSETWCEIPDAIITQKGFDINHLRLMVGKKFLMGAVVIGDQKLSTPLQALISDKVDITPIREQLLTPDAPIADILASFWSQVYASRN